MDRRTFLQQLRGKLPETEAIPIPSNTTLVEWKPSQDNPWDSNAINHLYHRLGFSASFDDVVAAQMLTPSEVIDLLMDDTLLTTGVAEPPLKYEQWMYAMPYTGPDYPIAHAEDILQHDAKTDIRNWWTVQMMKSQPQLREKLMLFWHNHFVVEEVKVYFAVHFWRYLDYLRRHPWGNLLQITKDITIMPAMLKYLDGVWSEKDSINENYAREVMELFTMGISDRDGNKNYTQDDIRNVAFALTGWRYRFEEPSPNVLPPYFADYYFDFNTKRSIFGADAKIYGLAAAKDSRIEADVIDLMFEKRGKSIAWNIAKKAYHNFVYMGDLPPSSNNLIQELADTLIASHWELKPMFAKLFKSEHFFDPIHRGGAIKSPYEFMISVCRKMNVPLTEYEAGSFWYFGMDTGQFLGKPPNVKGWNGYRDWLNTATLPKRINDIVRDLILNGWIKGQLINPHNGAPFDGIPYTDQQITDWAMQFDSYQTDLESLLAQMSDFLLAMALSSDRIKEVINRAGILHIYEWYRLNDQARVQPLRRLIYELLSTPEFQLA